MTPVPQWPRVRDFLFAAFALLAAALATLLLFLGAGALAAAEALKNWRKNHVR